VNEEQVGDAGWLRQRLVVAAGDRLVGNDAADPDGSAFHERNLADGVRSPLPHTRCQEA